MEINETGATFAACELSQPTTYSRQNTCFKQILIWIIQEMATELFTTVMWNTGASKICYKKKKRQYTILTWARTAARWICLARTSNFFIEISSWISFALLYSWPSMPLICVRTKASTESYRNGCKQTGNRREKRNHNKFNWRARLRLRFKFQTTQLLRKAFCNIGQAGPEGKQWSATTQCDMQKIRASNTD